MADETSAQAAIERLERAFARVEAAAARRRVPAGDPALEARHRRLQDEVQAALAGIDRLLGTAGAA